MIITLMAGIFPVQLYFSEFEEILSMIIVACWSCDAQEHLLLDFDKNV